MAVVEIGQPGGLAVLTNSEELAPFSVELTTNEALLALIKKWKTFQPEWPEIVEELKLTRINLGRIDSGHLRGILAELCLQQFLQAESACNAAVRLNPIPDGTQADNYIFTRPDRHRLNVVVERIGNDEKVPFGVEYDALTEIGGLPTLWELTISAKERRNRRGEVVRSSKRGAKSGVSAVIGRQRIDGFFAPLKEYYRQTLFAYVVVLDPEVINTTSSPTQISFLERGGQIVPFYTTARKFNARVLQLTYDYRLKSRLFG